MITFLRRTNIRALPDLQSAVLHTADIGDMAQLLSDVTVKEDGFVWYHVKLGTADGWCVRRVGLVELFVFENSAPELDRLTDIELLALMIAAEAGGQSLAGKVAVACVAVERVKRQRSHYGLTLRTVLLKPYQFSTFNPTATPGHEHWRRFTGFIGAHTLMAELAIHRLLLSPVATATHYLRTDVSPPPLWTHPTFSVSLGVIGDHAFYREK